MNVPFWKQHGKDYIGTTSRNFEARSDGRDDTDNLSSFHATSNRGRLVNTYDLACSRPHTQRNVDGIAFSSRNPPAPKPGTYTRPPHDPEEK
ncbi:hypothetical protein AVEN_169460-1 [Araneus ventricosus]|uniref:Uncharacterized protein n=1 Tax=Araneus ventricosus TaxID=182803 RepID=A0A4Y2NVM4_ARAVE|nr:hypothetical protein AVEN_169460-1 [Araneus ventricosus]